MYFSIAAQAAGKYTSRGPDINGRDTQLRASDGINVTKAGRAVMRPLVRAGQDIDLHRVDAQPGQVQPADAHIGGRKAQPLAALVAMLHRALDPVPVAKHMGCVARAALGQRGADRG